MKASNEQHLEMIRRTRRCRSEVLDAADKMADVETADFEKLARLLIEKEH